jgi:hypothetical protein
MVEIGEVILRGITQVVKDIHNSMAQGKVVKDMSALLYEMTSNPNG